jgi:hypothetical protein
MKSGTSLAIELKRGLFKNGNTSSSMSASIRTLLLVVCDTSPTTSSYPIESASSPLVCFGWLNDNMIKGLTRLLSVDRK